MTAITEVAITTQVPELFTAEDCQLLALVAAAHLPLFCKEWGLKAPTVTFYSDRSQVPATAYEITMLDKPAPADGNVEAFHEDPNGVPDGQCFAGFLLSQPGGNKWTGELAVSVAWIHELLEGLRNPRTNLILQTPIKAPDGKSYAGVWAEVCDPVQGGHVSYTVNGTEVWAAAFVTQSWEDPMGAAPYSVPEGAVGGPLKIGPGGYGGFVDGTGNVSTVFAADVHPAVKELKTAHGRVARGAKVAS